MPFWVAHRSRSRDHHQTIKNNPFPNWSLKRARKALVKEFDFLAGSSFEAISRQLHALTPLTDCIISIGEDIEMERNFCISNRRTWINAGCISYIPASNDTLVPNCNLLRWTDCLVAAPVVISPLQDCSTAAASSVPTHGPYLQAGWRCFTRGWRVYSLERHILRVTIMERDLERYPPSCTL